MRKLKSFLSSRPLWRDARGQFTIEASLVLPIVFLVVAMLLFLCLYLYQKSFLTQASSAVSERASFMWDNSHKEAVSGSVEPGLYDSLYWRLKDDHLLSGLFQLGQAEGQVSLQLPGGAASEADLPEVKLSKASLAVPAGVEGELRYENKLLLRRVYTQLSWPSVIQPLDHLLSGGMEVKALSQSVIVDPVEFIRTVELMRYYGSRFAQSGGGRMDPKAAAQVLGRFGGELQ